ncbi:MAG TPA: carboxypeptidase regulatory-like domain-containing protein [Bryobacteraceae bacterium]|nr:carboxypeptidase regulatory-like domain-containing protein [Bryobacteraceae bacterium]
MLTLVNRFALSLRSVVCAIACISLFLGTGRALLAQTATGNIVGRVTDTSGAVVAGVEVTAMNPDKGLTFRTTTDQEGIYRFYYLAPATYNLSFQHAGFASVERPGIALQSNETPTVDVQLAVGNVVQKLEVTAATPLVEAATSTTGTILPGREMNALPIMQRYTWMTMYLMPDVSSMNGFHIDGQRDRGLGYNLDGIPGTQPVLGGEATNRVVSTTPNAIEEVKLASTVLPAEYGHSAGGMLSATYKSGTNRFHWEGEDRYVNNAMLHRAYFNLGNAPFSYHELSSLASGPVYIPKLYHGNNKTFFLFGWSMHHERYNQSVFTSVPTLDELNGNFNFGGVGYPIYDPATITLANGKYTSNPFPGNVIPKSRFDPAIVKFLGYQPWDAPNNLGGSGLLTATGPVQNYGATSSYYSYRYRYDAKIDHNFSDSNRIYGRYSQVLNRAVGSQIGINWRLLDGTAVLQPVDQENAVISDTEVFSPTLLNEVRLGFNRWRQSRTPPGFGQNWAQQLGIPNDNGATFPTFLDSNGNQFFSTAFPGGFLDQSSQSYTFQDNVTLIKGAHSFRMGYEIVRTTANSLLQANPGGTFYFGGTALPFTPQTGNDFAAFLLGAVSKATFTNDLATWLPRWWSHALYFQDDWTASRRLTLNLGIRWSYETPLQTKYGQQSQFDPTATDPITGMPGAILHTPGPMGRSDYKHFQPRIGAAYKLKDNMVFRAGFGLTTIDLFAPGLTGLNSSLLNQNFEEYQSNVTVQNAPGNPAPAFYLSQGPGQINYNVLPNGTSPFVGTNYSSRLAERYDPNLRNAYAMNWNATYQYQFAPSWLLELSYQGSAGVGLLEAWNINTVPLNVSTNPATLQNIFQNYQNYRPFPNFGEVDMWSNFGHSTYHAGTVKVEKRFSHGFTISSFYTRSKAIDDCDNDMYCAGETYYNRSLEKGRAGYDLTNRTVTYATYALPVGRGRKFMNHGGVLDYIFGGWNVTWIQTFQTGLPVTFTMAGSPYNYLSGNANTQGSTSGSLLRPDQIVPNSQVVVPNWTIGDRFNTKIENPMWNINGFAYPAAFTAGTLGRNTINGPHLVWSQASASKDIHIREIATLQLRYDINNIFKNPNFINPSSVVNLGSPGLFGKPTSTQGGWCCLGGQFVATFAAKLTF